MGLGRRWWVAASLLIGAFVIGVVASLIGQTGTPPGSPRGDPAAIVRCRAIIPIASGFGTITSLLRAETSTAAAVAYWQEHRGRLAVAVSPFQKLSPQTRVTVCLLSGEFAAPVGPPGLIGGAKPPSLLRVLVWGNHEIVLDSAGYQGELAPETPSDLVTSP